jgi:hypothetical protein
LFVCLCYGVGFCCSCRGSVSGDRCIIALASVVYEGGGMVEFLGSGRVGGMEPTGFCGLR